MQGLAEARALDVAGVERETRTANLLDERAKPCPSATRDAKPKAKFSLAQVD